MIESAGLKDEESSPYFIKNRKICQFWDEYVENKKGTGLGKYTAWALLFKGNFNSINNWKVTVRKSTSQSSHLFVSNDNLVFSQTLIEATEINLGTSDFIIRKWNLVDYAKREFIPKLSRLNINPNYAIIGNLKGEALIKCINILKSLINKNELEQLRYSVKSNHFKINIHSLLTDRKLIDKITGIE